MKKLPIDLLVFDFDGTLTDSIPPAIESIQAMLKELHLPVKTAEEINPHVGFGEIALVAGAIGSDDPALIQTARELYFKHYTQEGIKKVALFPHVREMLDFFKEKSKAIISNKRDLFVRMILQQHGLLDYFCEILGGDTSPCLKPDPCALLRILRDNQIDAERTLFIGDMTVDVETGKNAGVHTCAVTYGFDPRSKLEKSRPDFLIDDLIELKELID